MPRKKMSRELRGEKIEQILDAARTVFARKGTAATMAEVAAAAGISQGLAYRYFPSKEAILTSLVKRSAGSGGGPAERIKKIPGSAGKRLEALISYIVADRRERPEFYQFLYQVLTDDAVQGDLRQVVRRNGREIQDVMRTLIVEGQATGEVVKDDPDQLMAALVSSIDGLVRWMPLFNPELAEEHYPDARIFLRMLKPELG
ncbi:MAG: TetR/AcrR family transcriptional regulator [Nitrososphaerales archaeon]|jgi:AcrR family transcriptional regulator